MAKKPAESAPTERPRATGNILLAELIRSASILSAVTSEVLRYGLDNASPDDPHVLGWVRLQRHVNDLAGVAKDVRESIIHPRVQSGAKDRG